MASDASSPLQPRRQGTGRCVHLWVSRRTLAKKRGAGGGSHRTRGSALSSDPPILQRMWETASLGSRWLAPAFHVRRPCVYLLAPLALPVGAVSCCFRRLALASQSATASAVCSALRGGDPLQISWGSGSARLCAVTQGRATPLPHPITIPCCGRLPAKRWGVRNTPEVAWAAVA